MSTYRQVRTLIDDLSKTTAVQKRRSIGKDLQEFMMKSDIRKRLANEAGQAILKGRSGGSSGRRQTASLRVARRKALSALWRRIVIDSAVAVESLYEGKAKFAEGDINFLLRIIQACEIATEGFENAYSTSKLTRKETRIVTRLCLRLLEDESVLQIAESRLLEMLAFICSSREYVTHFKPIQEIQMILEEVEKRIISDEDTVSQAVIISAATVFENLITTSCDLGITMHRVIPGSIKLVATWCASVLKREAQENRVRQVSEQSKLFNVVCALMRSNPEQVIAPLRRHGKPILSFVRRRYATAGELQLRIFNEYILCHM